MGGDIGWALQTMLMVVLSIDDVVCSYDVVTAGFAFLHNTVQNDAPKNNNGGGGAIGRTRADVKRATIGWIM